MSPDPVEKIVDEFEAAWQRGQPPDVEALLPEGDLRPAVLEELAHVDLEFRLKAGQPARVEDYLRRWPALADDPATVLGLALAEYKLRKRRHDAVSRKEFLGRFADHRHELLHRLPADPEVPGYEVLGELGRDGVGVVYKARQLSPDRVVSLKKILTAPHAAGRRQGFEREARVVAQLRHEHIVRLFEFAVDPSDGLPYFTMEYLDGETLERKLNRQPLAFAEAARMVEQLARAVQHAHEHGVVHGDLKPANVLVTADGTPRITDFGLARWFGTELGQTRSGPIMGTPGFMAPEQATGRGQEVGPATDVWALGGILYQMLTGQPPVAGTELLEILRRTLHEEILPPSTLRPGVPRDLETICLKCLRKDPRRRYGSAKELTHDLRCYLDSKPIRGRTAGPSSRRGWWLALAILAVVLLLTVSTVVLLRFIPLW